MQSKKGNSYKYLCFKARCKNNFVQALPLLTFHWVSIVNPDSGNLMPKEHLCWRNRGIKSGINEVREKKHIQLFRNMAEFDFSHSGNFVIN